jgi:hypothetical protein
MNIKIYKNLNDEYCICKKIYKIIPRYLHNAFGEQSWSSKKQWFDKETVKRLMVKLVADEHRNANEKAMKVCPLEDFLDKEHKEFLRKYKLAQLGL